MRPINLLPQDATGGRKRLTAPVVSGIVATVLVLTVLASGYLLEGSKVAQGEASLSAAQTELAMIPPPPPPAPGEQFDLPGQQAARVAALHTAIAGRIAWDRILRELALVLPKDVWLDRLQVQTPGDTATDTFKITGTAYSHDGVARLMTRLQVVPELSNVHLLSSHAIVPGKRGAVQFDIAAVIRPAESTT
jgi:Tfp pilus assembly protein PilN